MKSQGKILAEVIQKVQSGWTQDGWLIKIRGKIKYCIMAAIYSCGVKNWDNLIKVERAIATEIRKRSELGIMKWNNHPRRNKEQVIKLLRKVQNNIAKESIK